MSYWRTCIYHPKASCAECARPAVGMLMRVDEHPKGGLVSSVWFFACAIHIKVQRELEMVA